MIDIQHAFRLVEVFIFISPIKFSCDSLEKHQKGTNKKTECGGNKPTLNMPQRFVSVFLSF